MKHSVTVAALLALGAAHSASAGLAAPLFSSDARRVTLDGVALGDGLTPQTSGSLRFSVAYDADAQRYHLWVMGSDDPAFSPASLSLPNIRHGVSSDGVAFTADGALEHIVGNPYPGPFGTQVDPPVSYLRAQPFDGEWKLLFWHANDQQSPSRWGEFNYNTSVASLGSTPWNRAALLQGPIRALGGGTSPGGQHVGAFGIVNGQLYLRVDSSVGGLARFAYVDGLPSEVTPYPTYSSEADLFAGSPYVWFLANPGAPNAGYVHNAGRVIEQFDGTIAAYYAFRRADGSRADKQVWRVTSGDDGLTWSDAQPLFAADAAFSLDGESIAADGLFGTPEVTIDAHACRVYFSTRDADGAFVVAVSEAVPTAALSDCYRPDAIFADGYEGDAGPL